MQQAQAQGEAAHQQVGREAAQRRNMPGRRDHVDVGQGQAALSHQRRKRVTGELLRLLAAVETLFLEDIVDRPVAQEREAAIMGFCDETEDLHTQSGSR